MTAPDPLLCPAGCCLGPQQAPGAALKHARGKLADAAAVGRRPAPQPPLLDGDAHRGCLFLQMSLLEEAASAVVRNKLHRLQAALSQEPSLLTDRDSDGYTLLHRAAFMGSTECLRILLAAGACTKATSTDGVKVKVKVGKSLHRLNFPVLTSSFRPLFDLPDAPSAVPPTSSEWVPGRPVPKPWRF